VLADIRAQGVADILCVGAMASGPLNAPRTIDLLIAADPTRSLRGNQDRCLTADSTRMVASDHSADAELPDAHWNWLPALPATTQHRDISLCPGTSISVLHQWLTRPDRTGA
jgi:hypothetical protein